MLREDEATRKEVALQAKMDLEAHTRTLMPEGRPNYSEVPKYPAIKQIAAIAGQPTVHKVLLMLVYDFCRSVNVVRNMDEMQMVEAAGVLLDECGNFRLEDYVIMFTMAKRGHLMKIMDRIDIQLISQMLDAYWIIRDRAGKMEQEREVKEAEKAFNAPMGEGFGDMVVSLKEILKSTPDIEPIVKPLNTTHEGAAEILKNINLDAIKK